MDLLKASAAVLSESKLGDSALYTAASKDLVHIFSGLHPNNRNDADWKKFADDFSNSVYKTDEAGLEYLELPKNKVKVYLAKQQPTGVSGKHVKVMKDLNASWHIFS